MHGKVLANTDSLTSGAQIGAEIAVPPPVDPHYINLKEVVVNWSSASVTGAALLTIDVRDKNGNWADSGWPSISVTGTATGQYTAGAVNFQLVKSVRTHCTTITGGTCTTITYLVDLT